MSISHPAYPGLQPRGPLGAGGICRLCDVGRDVDEGGTALRRRRVSRRYPQGTVERTRTVTRLLLRLPLCSLLHIGYKKKYDVIKL